ncbi:MAG: TonB-dependent receptor [Kordiimonadaceae bacterium]|nr:TonB-dependent receptor [Kordiimonadaceae bacterium]
MTNNRFYVRHGKAALAAVSSLAIMAVSPAAVAQDQDGSADEETFEEIVVQGRFQQSVIDRLPITPEELPFTLHSVGRDALDELNYARPIDAIANLPNISIFADLFNTGTPVMLTRGYFSPLLVDNRAENSFRGVSAQDDSFVSSYEVLKGPASVSVGAVESGGIFNTVTKSPEADPFVGVELRTDQFGTVAGEFDVNTGAVAGNDAVKFRISGAYRNWQYDAKETKRETFAIRPVIVADLGESTSVKVSGNYIRHNVNPNKGFAVYIDGTVPEHITSETFTSYQNAEATSETKYIAGEIIHDFLDNLTLKVRGSHAATDMEYQNTSGFYNYGSTQVTGPDDRRRGIDPDAPYVDSYSYAGDIEERNTYLDAQIATFFEFNGQTQDIAIGATYNENSFQRIFIFPDEGFYNNHAVEDIGQPKYGVEDFSSFDRLAHNDDSGSLKSVYIEAALRPIEDLTIVTGVRYDEVKQKTFNYRRGGVDTTTSATTFRIGGTYQVSDSLGVYTSYAQAFTPNTGFLQDGSHPGAQRTGGWEFGIKGNLLDDTLKINVAYFHTIRTNLAVRVGIFPDLYSATIGEQRVRGFEVSADWAPVEGFNISLQYGYLDIDILSDEAEGIPDFSIPTNTFSAFASYTFQDGSLEGLKVGGGPRYTGSKPSQYVNFGADDYPAITLVDAYVSYPVTEDITVSLNAHNLLDKFYRESTGSWVGRTSGSHVVGAPRTVSLTVRARF